MILIVDFGSQVAHLISRRVNDLGAKTQIVLPEEAVSFAKKEKPQGIILSGGPSSVYDQGAPTIDKQIFELDIPVLGICYGLQLMMQLLGGKVVSGKKEYGPATLSITNQSSQMAISLPQASTVWVSHGDEVVKMASGFKIVGSTERVPLVVCRKCVTKNLWRPVSSGSRTYANR